MDSPPGTPSSSRPVIMPLDKDFLRTPEEHLKPGDHVRDPSGELTHWRLMKIDVADDIEYIDCCEHWRFRATKRKLRNGKAENSLRSAELSIAEDISMIQSECGFKLEQMLELKNQISHVAHQISTAKICSVSEKFKMDHHLKSNISTHKQGFEATFARERTISKLHNKELKEKEAKKEEIERQKFAKVLEQNEQKGKEAAAMESECDAIERECSVLTKRNKAIMLKLRRKLVEAEDSRRELMKKNGLVPK